MKLPLERLGAHLGKPLAPLYLISGDEILLVEEAGDQIRASARNAGYEEREVFHTSRGFHWELIAHSCMNLSLFSAKRLIEIRLLTAKPGTEGGKVLVALASKLPSDTIILVFCPKMDATIQKTFWVNSLEKAGVWINIRTIESSGLPTWIEARMKTRGLFPESAAVQSLADRVEGNLLAASQEIEKLLLLRGPGPVDVQTVESSVADNARFDLYALSNACLAGETSRAVRIFYSLQATGAELPLLLWVIVRELRALATIESGLIGVWEPRRSLLQQATKRLGIRKSEQLLKDAAYVDRCVKGSSLRDPWSAMLQLIQDFSTPANLLEKI
ncbi:DNA polymerase III subunit delta [Gammaproteobacteria bacterium]